MRAIVILACLAASAGSAGAAPPAPPPVEGEPAEGGELRQVLREYFVRLLVSDLGMSDSDAQALAPLVKQLLDTQRETGRERQRLVRELRDASVAADETRSKAALDSFDTFEQGAVARLTARRTAVVERLSIRQAARFLAFEERFRQRVRELLEERRGGAATRPLGEGPEPRAPEPPRPRGPEAEPGASPLHDEVMETMKVLFVHEMRQALDLSLDATLTMLPDVDAHFAGHADFQREQRASLRDLRRAAEDDGVTEAELRRLVTRARALDGGVLRLAEARRRVTRHLSPAQAAGFVAFEQRFWPEARRRARALGRAQGPPDGRPGPAGRPGRPRHGLGGQ